MTSATTDTCRAAGELLKWAASHTTKPAADERYRSLVERYLNEPAFAEAVRSMCSGAGLNVLDVSLRDGIIVAAASDSPLRMPMSKIWTTTDVRRTVIGLIILATARCAYPDRSDLDDTTQVPFIEVGNIVAFLDQMAEELSHEAPKDGNQDPHLAEVWRHWNALSPIRANQKVSSVTDRPGAVRSVLKKLTAAGMLNEFPGTSDVYSTTQRFRVAVIGLCENNELYRSLNALEDAALINPASDYATNSVGTNTDSPETQE